MKGSKARIIFIFITVTLDMIGIGLVIPSLPDVLRRFISDPTEVSNYFGYFISVYAAMQFLASPLLGAISDMVGRRPVLLLSLFAGGLDYLLMAFAPNLFILFASRIISGLMGANVTVAMAYIADISTDKDRAANFGMIGAAFGLGFIIGPAIGGILGDVGPQYPFIIAACVTLLNFIFGFFVLPESFPKEKRKKIQFSKINPFVSLVRIFTMPNILALAFVHFFLQMAGQTHPSIWTLYSKFRYGWNNAQIGLSLATVGLLSAFAQGWLTRIFIPKFGEYKVVFISTLGFVFAYSAFGLASEGWMVYAILILSCVFWTSQPALQALITEKIPAHEQGELQGSLISLTSLASIINPILSTHLFAAFTRVELKHIVPGAPYFCAAFMSLLAFSILFSVKIRSKLRKSASA